MKKVSRRTAITFILSGLLVLGLLLFGYRLATEGADWAVFPSNSHIYRDGRFRTGAVMDRRGNPLLIAAEDGYHYSTDSAVRLATLHAVGDLNGNISTGATRVLADALSGYNLLTGVSGSGGELRLSIDADVCAAAYSALGGRNGAVGVMDYRTGELICIVSAPGFDPAVSSSTDTEGAYLNKLFSAAFTPGSVFKLVTAAAALEQIPDIHEREFYCPGSVVVGDELVTCSGTHGSLDFDTALAKSCNCAFAELALELGADTLTEYTAALGLAQSHSFDGITTAAGSIDAHDENPAILAWSGIGQANDLVCPLAVLRLCAAIANDGIAVTPRLTTSDEPAAGTRLLSPETADTLKRMMRFCVSSNYGEDSFPGLAVGAKSGTAEVDGSAPHAWFAGFADAADTPWAFVVIVENGGSGAAVAAPVANAALQAARRLSQEE